jgi:cysteinyl-tRNA synthetase
LGLIGETRKEKIPDEVLKLVEERESARKKKEWTISDALREKIKSLGHVVQDTKEGPNIKKVEDS